MILLQRIQAKRARVSEFFTKNPNLIFFNALMRGVGAGLE